MKTCRSCGVEKQLDDFYKHPNTTDRRQLSCKECDKKRVSKWAKDNPERANEKSRESNKRYPDRVREYQKRWRKANPNSRSAQWPKLNPEKQKARTARWVKNNPAKNAAKAARRRASMRLAIPSFANPSLIAEIYELANMKTRQTGIVHEVDHIVPLQSPIVCGFHVESNLMVIPRTKNRSKHNRTWPDMPSNG